MRNFLISRNNTRSLIPAWIISVAVVSFVLLGNAKANVTDTSSPSAIVYSIQDDLQYDENGKLARYHLVYPADQPDCPAARAPPTHGFDHHAVAGDALQLVFPDYHPGECVAACLERGTDRSLAGHTMPHQHSDPTKRKNFKGWFEVNCQRVEACLMNYRNKEEPLTLHWIHPDTGVAREHKTIPYGDRNTQCFLTYLGHRFEVRDGDTLVEQFTIEHVLVKAFGESPPSGRVNGRTSFDREIKATLTHEWDRHNAVKRTFSALGFAKGRLPPDVFASMGALYYNNRHNKVHEEWNGRGVFVNWWETDVSFIQIPWGLKEKWQIRLAELVSAWVGVEVEQTVMYGLRQYEDGARLLTHVDRKATHAVSLIVNIAQGDLVEPWPVEIFDHADRLHEVVMEPGDIVYYESAKNLHSRNRPLKGKDGGGYYVNLFTHYRPVGDGDTWHTKSDQVGVSEPVMEVEGDCRLKQVGTTATATGQLGIVQQVECNDARLGPYISPTLFQAKGPDDLIEWWQRTAPDYVEDSSSTVGSSTTTPNSGMDEL